MQISALYKTIIPFYIVCFALYIFFSRRPDYQDGEFTTAIIHYSKDDKANKSTPKAVFSVDNTKDTINAYYPLRRLQKGERVKIIYESSEPSKAAVYSWWGYWIKWDELLASILIPLILLYAAKAITAGPTPEALVEELEMKNPTKRKKYE